ncbi:MAG: glycosyltransferase family 2 protein [Candidatus Sumerlaeia bacterium]|nr:glycosyltransferase family 2 protein [Candidatus Sumerlaeia bacterium]
MTNHQPSMSIVVATFERGTMLLETIESILSQDYDGFELLIVDQTPAHPEDVFRQLEELNTTGRIRWIREAIPNLPRARNIGLLHAKGGIVLYLDDDVLLPDGFLARHAAHYKKADIHAVTGMILHPGEKFSDRPTLDLPRKKAARRLDLQTMRFRTRLRNPSHFVGANMSFRRQTLLGLGGFSHQFDGSALGEDMELAGRLHRAGYTSVYDPKCHLLHRVAEFGGCRDRNERTFSRSRARLRNYYFAVCHGLTLFHASEVIAMRWLGRFTRRQNAGSNHEATITAPKGGRLPSLAGRFVGALEGVWKAWRNRHVGGDLAGLQLAGSQPCVDNKVISIIIPTYNRGAHLVRTLRALLTRERQGFEVILVDQTGAHPPDIQKELDSITSDPRIRCFRQKIPNASMARNTGARESSAPILLFLDDDITPMEGLFERHLECYTNARISAVGGRIIWSEEGLEKLVPARFGTTQAAHWPELPVCYTTTPFDNALHLITCNMSVRRDRFLEVGGFNERFRGYGEDLELVARLQRAGGYCAYEPRAAVVHHSAPAGGTRQGGASAFPLGFRRGRDQNLSTLLAVGFAGWIGYTYRRQTQTMKRAIGLLLGGRSREYYLPEGTGGPATTIMKSRGSRVGRIYKLLQYKVPQLVGALAGTTVAVVVWLYIPDERGSLHAGNKGERR